MKCKFAVIETQYISLIKRYL